MRQRRFEPSGAGARIVVIGVRARYASRGQRGRWLLLAYTNMSSGGSSGEATFSFGGDDSYILSIFSLTSGEVGHFFSQAQSHFMRAQGTKLFPQLGW